MHTSRELSSASFTLRCDGEPASLHSIFGEFSDQDRIGVVVRRPCGAVGASTLILACVTAFYDIQRSRAQDFFVYPDYFLFHVGERLGDHRRLDIWPSHKEVVVRDQAEELLRAINDRGVTRLLVEDRSPCDGNLRRESVASARARIATTLAYSPDGRVADPDVEIAGDAVTESYVAGVLEHSRPVATFERAALEVTRSALAVDGRPIETYRRLTLDDALARL